MPRKITRREQIFVNSEGVDAFAFGLGTDADPYSVDAPEHEVGENDWKWIGRLETHCANKEFTEATIQ